MDPLLTVADVADRLQCSQRYVLDELRRGNLVGARLGVGWRVDEAALQSYVDVHLNVRPIRRRRPPA